MDLWHVAEHLGTLLLVTFASTLIACCVSSTVRTSCFASGLSLLLWSTDASRRSRVYRKADGFIQLENLHLHSVLSASQLRDATKMLPLEVAELSVRTLRFKLPDLSRWTLEIAVDGLTVSLKQKSMPPKAEPAAAPERNGASPSADAQERQSRLEIVDTILWDARPRAQGRASGSGWLQASWFVQAFHAAVALAMRALVLHVTDTEALVLQDTVPGPWQPKPDAHLRRHREGVSLKLRSLSVQSVPAAGRPLYSAAPRQQRSPLTSKPPRNGQRGGQGRLAHPLVPAAVRDLAAALREPRKAMLEVEGCSVMVLTSLPVDVHGEAAAAVSTAAAHEVDGVLHSGGADGATPAHAPHDGAHQHTPLRTPASRWAGAGTSDGSSSTSERIAAHGVPPAAHRGTAPTVAFDLSATDKQAHERPHGRQNGAQDASAQDATTPAHMPWAAKWPVMQNWGFTVALTAVPASAAVPAASRVAPQNDGETQAGPKDDESHERDRPAGPSMRQASHGLLFQLPTAVSTPAAGQRPGAPALSRIPESTRFLAHSPSNLGSGAARGAGRAMRRANTMHSRSVALGMQRSSAHSQHDSRSSAVSTAQLNKLFDSPRVSVPSGASKAEPAPSDSTEPCRAAAAEPAPPTIAPEQRNLLKVDIELRAFVPELTVGSLAVLTRFGMRAAAYSNMSEAWASRPSVPIAVDPQAWWRHAITMVKQECRKMRRHTTSIVAAMRRRKMRATHARLYRRVHMQQANFHAPDRKWWQMWPQRPAMASDVEELALLEDELTLEEVINFRTRTALRCSNVMRHRTYRTLAVPILGAMAVNPRKGLPANLRSVLLGYQVEPPLSRLPIAATLCATARCPRIGVVLHTGGESSQTLHAAISMYSAALDATSRISQTVQSAKIELAPSAAAASASDAEGHGVEGAVALLEAPCASFVLLHQYDDCESMETPPQAPTSDEDAPLLTMSYRPPGVRETATETESMALGAAYDRETAHQDSQRQRSGSPGTLFRDAAEHSGHDPSGSMHSDLSGDAVPLSDAAAPYAASPPNSGDPPPEHRASRSFRHQESTSSLDGAAASLQARLNRLRGSELLGSVLVDVAPVEAFVDTPALLGLLELGLALQTRVALGDAEFARAARCNTTATAVLAQGSLTSLVREGLVRHSVAVQAASPPALPSIAVSSRGLVGRIGLARDPLKGDAAAAQAPVSALHAADYEFIVSAVNLRATLTSRFDVTSQLSTACITYDAGTRLDVEAGFKRSQLTELLREPEVAPIVREVHEAAKVAWLHPGEGGALLSAWQRMAAAPGEGGYGTLDGGGGRMSMDEMRNWKQLYPDLILDPDRDPFPAIPAIKIAGVSICDSNVIPLIPTAAGTRHVAATMRTTGVQIAVSPAHLRLFRSFAAAVDEVVGDVSRRGRAATHEAMPGLLDHEDSNEPSHRGQQKGGSTVTSVATKNPAQRSAFNVRMTGLVHVPVIVLVGFMSRDANHTHLRPAPWVGELIGAEDHTNRRSLGTRWPAQAFDAARWGRNLAPICDFTLTDIRLGFDIRGDKALGATATLGALLATDLQAGRGEGVVRVGPLSYRAAQMQRRAAIERRILFGLQPPGGNTESAAVPMSADASRSASGHVWGQTSGVPPLNMSASANRSSVFGGLCRPGYVGRYLWRKCRRLFWLQNRCYKLLSAQQRMRPHGAHADTDFTVWASVFRDACAIRADTRQQAELSIIANDHGAAGLEASVTLSFWQLHASIVLTGGSTIIAYAADLLAAASPPPAQPAEGEQQAGDARAGCSTEPHVTGRPAGVGGEGGGGDDMPAVERHRVATPQCNLRRMTLVASLRLAAAQVTLRAGRRRFVEALLTEVNTEVHADLDPMVKPALLLGAASTMGAVRIDHGRDMLTHTDCHRSVLTMPCRAPEAPAIELGGECEIAEVPAAPTGMVAGGDRRHWSDEDECCLQLRADQFINLDGCGLAGPHPKASVQLTISDPQLTLQMSFIEDCITLYDTIVDSLAPVLGAGDADDDGGGESAPASSCSDLIDMPFVLQAQIHGGSIVVPAKAEARSALVGFARTLTLGLPAHAIAGVSTSLVAAGTGSAPRQMLHTKQLLPDVSELMEQSGAVLRRHRTMTQIRGRRTEPSPPSDGAQASEEASASDAADSTGANDGSESGMGAKLGGMKDWLKSRLDQMKPLWSESGSAAADAGNERHTQEASPRAPPEIGPWTPEQLARFGQRSESGRGLRSAEALGGSGTEHEGQAGAGAAAYEEARTAEVTGGDAVRGDERAADVDLCERPIIAVIGDSYQVYGCQIACDALDHSRRWPPKGSRHGSQLTRDSQGTNERTSLGHDAEPSRKLSRRSGKSSRVRWTQPMPSVFERRFENMVPIFSEAHLVAGLSFTANSAVNVHFSSSPVWTYVSPASYWHILDACTGNFVEDGRLDPTEPDPVAPRRAYDPQLRMWPPTSTPLVATITISCPESYLLFQADPQTWEAGAPPRPIAEAPRAPFALIKATYFEFSAVIADNNDIYETYLSWDAAAADTFDMRLARYHLLRQPWRQQRARQAGPPPAPSQRWQSRWGGSPESPAAAAGPGSPDRAGGSPMRGQGSALARLSSGAGGLSQRAPSDWGPDATSARAGAEGFGPMPDQDRLNQTSDPVIKLADYRSVGLLRVSEAVAPEYQPALAAIADLPPWQQSDASQVPLVHLSSAPVDHKAAGNGFAEHLPVGHEDGGYDESSPVFAGSFCVLADKSMGIDVILRNCLMRWPWLTELSLLSALMSIFVPDEKDEPDDADSQLLPWMYVNAVLENVQFVLPLSRDLLKLSELLDAVRQQARDPSAAGEASGSRRRSASDASEGRSLFSMASIYQRVSKVPVDALSQAVVQRPAVFQLMGQAMLNRMRELEELRPLHSTAGRTHDGNIQMATPFLTSPSPSLGGGGMPEHTVSPQPAQRPAELNVGDLGSEAGDELQLRPSEAFTEMAVVFTLRAARYGLFYGDDGKSVQVGDIWGAAGHALHPESCMQCWLLPCSLSADVEEQTPLLEEQRRLKQMQLAARTIQRCWRVRNLVRTVMQYARRQGYVLPGAAAQWETAMDNTGHNSAWDPVASRIAEEAPTMQPSASVEIIDRLLQAELEPEDRQRLQKLVRQRQTIDLGVPRLPTRRTAQLKVHTAALRLAFSHLPLHRLLKAQAPILQAAMAVAPAMGDGSEGSEHASGKEKGSATTEEKPAFRQVYNKLQLSVQEASAWLCSDGQNSFGAPDVLQGAVTGVKADAEVDFTSENAPPTVVTHLHLHPSVRFLDNSSSNWEWLLSPWRVNAEYLFSRPPPSAAITDSASQFVSVSSHQHAIMHFNPAVLLMVGDVMSFAEILMAADDDDDLPPGGTPQTGPMSTSNGAQNSVHQSGGIYNAKTRPPQVAAYQGDAAAGYDLDAPQQQQQSSSAPSMGEQMALSMPLTERLPQRYCIQNHLGVRLWYWAPSEHDWSQPSTGGSKHELHANQSQQLRCKPPLQTVLMEPADGSKARRQQAAISILLEGNWLPIANVLVNQVGKYRYQLYSPHENASVHIVVDILLVSRTKVISIHSPVWIENATDLHLRARLHVPTSLLAVMPAMQSEAGRSDSRSHSESALSLAVGAGGSAGTASPGGAPAGGMPVIAEGAQQRRAGIDRQGPAGGGSRALRPLAPGAGRYLPLAAMLDGVLSLTPKGHEESTRDVLRISDDLHQLARQQGFLHSASPACLGAVRSQAPSPHHTSIRSQDLADALLSDPPALHPLTTTNCFLHVSCPTKSRSDFGMLPQMEQVSDASFRSARSAVFASVVVKPTVTFTNALPFAAKVTVLETWAANAAQRGEDAATFRPPECAVGEEEAAAARAEWPDGAPGGPGGFVTHVKAASVTAERWQPGLPPKHSTARDLLFAGSSPLHSQLSSGARLGGRHVTLSVAAGASLNVYANLDHPLLIFQTLPLLHLRSSNWSVLTWGRSPLGPKYDPLTNKPLGRTKLSLPKTVHMVPYPPTISDAHAAADEREGATGSPKRTRFARRVVNFATCGRKAMRDGQIEKDEDWPGMLEATRAAAAEPGAMGAAGPLDSAAVAATVATRKIVGQTSAALDVVDGAFKRTLGGGAATAAGAASCSAAPTQRPSGDARRGGEQATIRETETAESEAGQPEVAGRDIGKGGATADKRSAADWRLLQSAFDIWRCARIKGGQRAPKSVYLAIANNTRGRRRAEGATQGESLHCCHVTIYAPYWVANSSSCVLKIWDRPADSQLMGLPDVLDFSAMLCPRGVFGLHAEAPGEMPPLHVLPCILNRQRKVKLSVAAGWSSAASHRGAYSKDVNIAVVGSQPGVTLNGPEFTCSVAEEAEVDLGEAEAAHAAQKHAQNQDVGDGQNTSTQSETKRVRRSMRWEDARAVVAHDRAVPEAASEVDSALNRGDVDSSLDSEERAALRTAAREASAAVAQPQDSVAASAAGSSVAKQPSDSAGLRSGDPVPSPRTFLQRIGETPEGSPLQGQAVSATERRPSDGRQELESQGQATADPMASDAPPRTVYRATVHQQDVSALDQRPSGSRQQMEPQGQATTDPLALEGPPRAMYRATVRQQHVSSSDGGSQRDASHTDSVAMPGPPGLPTSDSLLPAPAEPRPTEASSGDLRESSGASVHGASTPLGTWLEGHKSSHARPAFPPLFSSPDAQPVSLTALDRSESAELWAPAGATVTGSSAQSNAESTESTFDVHRLRPPATRASVADREAARGAPPPGPVAESGRRREMGIAALQPGAELRVTPPTRSAAGSASEASPDVVMSTPRREQQELLPRDRADSSGPQQPPASAAAAEYVSQLQLQGHIADWQVEMVQLPATPALQGQPRGAEATPPPAKQTPRSAMSTASTARRGAASRVSWSESPPPHVSGAGGSSASATKLARLRRLSRSSASSPDERGSWASGLKLSGATRHRAYDVAVEVKSGLAKSCFRYTKMLHLKDKYVLENCTGETLEVKQRGTPDPGVPFGPGRRSACILAPGAYSPLFWDDASLPRHVVVRLVDDGPGDWAWSGGFEPQEKEDYFGVRMHHRGEDGRRDGESVIVPVSISVGASGAVRVSFKSRRNLPPYRIINACASVNMTVSQAIPNVTKRDKLRAVTECMPPGTELAFAWDEPTADHTLRVAAQLRNFASHHHASGSERLLNIDDLPSKPLEPLVIRGSIHPRQVDDSAGLWQDAEAKARLEGALSEAVQRQVHIEIFADGPTRVVRFSDTETADPMGASNFEMLRRIQLLQERLVETDRRFAALRGGASIERLDLFGRAVPAAQRLRRGATAGAEATVSREVSTTPAPHASEIVPRPPSRASGGATDAAAASQSLPARGPAVAPDGTAAAAHAAAVSMMLAGDLVVTVLGMRGLPGEGKNTNPMVRLSVGSQMQQTSVQWDTLEPTWDESLTFYRVAAGSELTVECWDIAFAQSRRRGGSGSSGLSSHADMSSILARSRFLGQVRVPLSDTLPPPGAKPPSLENPTTARRTYMLARRTGRDMVAGAVTLAFEWSVSATSLLRQKHAVLEKVLMQRVEILSMLSPMTVGRTRALVRQGERQLRSGGAMGASRSVGRRFVDGHELASAQRLEARQEEYDVSVSILEVRNVPVRRGLGAAITANDAPHASVIIRCADTTRTWTAKARGVDATFDRSQRHTFPEACDSDALVITVCDEVNNGMTTHHARCVLPLQPLELKDPVYVWVPASRLPRSRRNGMRGVMQRASLAAGSLKVALCGAHQASSDMHFDPLKKKRGDVLVYMRVHATPSPRSHANLSATLALAGAGVIVGNGAEEELLALSFHTLRASVELRASDATIQGSIQAVQIDDQSLEASQPVVLGPAGVVTKGLQRVQRKWDSNSAAATAAATDPYAAADAFSMQPLLMFRVIRSFAHQSERTPHLARLGSSSSDGGSGSGGGEKPEGAYDQAAAALTAPDDATAAPGSILSFKEVTLELGPVDVTGNEAFLSSIFSFVVQLPMQDVWQDEAWQRRNRLAVNNAEAPFDASAYRAPSGATEVHDLHFLSADHNTSISSSSVFGTWFFIEHLHISDINANVTVTLSSNIAALLNFQTGNSGPPDDVDGGEPQGVQLMHVVKSSGFQLINVNNVAMQLKGKTLDSKLLSTMSAFALLRRHYFSQALREAHKVLGGTGPAVAQLPLTVIWAGGTVFDLTRDLAARRVGALSVLPRMGFITLTGMAQLIGVASKLEAALLAMLPYERTGSLSDGKMVARYIVRPQNAVEAFGMARRAILLGFAAAIVGLVSDPVAGWKAQGVIGVVVGMLKALLGFLVRPMSGLAELVSKSTQGCALVCLGRQGIQGRIMRRVYAPGITRRVHDAQRMQEQQSDGTSQRERLLAAWQASLGHLSERFANDTIADVMVVRARRVLLLTKEHVVYCRASNLADGTATYRVRWYLRMHNVNNVLSDEGQLVVIIRAYAVVKLKFVGTWRLPITKRVRTANLETFEMVTSTLNDQVTAPRAWQPAEAVVDFPEDRDLRALRITAGLAVEGHEGSEAQGQPRAAGRLRNA